MVISNVALPHGLADRVGGPVEFHDPTVRSRVAPRLVAGQASGPGFHVGLLAPSEHRVVAATKATWANVPSVTSTSQPEAPLALANMLYYTEALATS